jgi:methyltransferase-like protein/predicted O-methyltransferase YrrM
MSDATLPEYDEFPYPSRAFVHTHPDRMATIATLFSMQPPPANCCRVLELGCACGGNLIPLAQALPESTFIGVDLSRRQIADGQAVVEALGLSNIELRHADILDVDASWGKFDYIIAHGVYSWVSPDVQDRLLEICGSQLASQGIAYVSYNTYPGWRARGLIRDMMLYHVRRFPDRASQVREARTLLDFYALAASKDSGAYALMLQEEVALLRKQPDSYLLHEYLTEANEPLFFHQFMKRLTPYKLQNLAEAQPSALALRVGDPALEGALRRLSPDLIHLEQYTDFLRNRGFRSSLLVHEGISLHRDLRGEQLLAFHISSPCRPLSPKPNLTSPTVEEYEHPNGLKLQTSDVLMKSAMSCLAAAWPSTVPFPELCTAARARLGVSSQTKDIVDRDTQQLGTRLLTCYLSELVELHRYPPDVVTAISAEPMVSPLARLEAGKGRTLTTPRHEMIEVDELTRQVSILLDGQHDPPALVARLMELVKKGALMVQKEDQQPFEAGQLRQVVANCVSESLERLARSGMLIG